MGSLMLNPYEISMLLMVFASFVYMMFILARAIEKDIQEKEAKSKKE